MHTAMKSERGAALIMVLWFAVALGIIAVDLTLTTRDTALKVANTEAGIRARAALDAARNVAFELLRRGQFDRSGKADWRFDGISIALGIEPESGKVDLNGASEELIEGLARSLVDDEDDALNLAHAILDWRDENDLQMSHGVEDRDYRLAGLNYGSADYPFQHVSELNAVLGVSDEQYAALAPNLTIATGFPEPDEFLASQFVLEAVDVARGLTIERGQNREEESDGEELTASEGDEEADAPEQAVVEEGEDLELLGLNFFDDPSGLYTLDFQARLPAGYTERSRSLVWVDPPFETVDFLVLQHESALLPRTQRDTAEQ
jgi:general secretion pathway protein K